ncbi:MAG: SDR family NAD(P)-dependent oxidoreductase [Acidobacteriota bacterium]
MASTSPSAAAGRAATARRTCASADKPPGALRRGAARALSRLVDPTVVFSFDHIGYRVHALGFDPTALDVDLRDRVCLVTGANSGLGLATARGLAQRGARLWMLCRSEARGAAARARLIAETGHDDIHLAIVDVADNRSIDAFMADFPEVEVDVLVHNAGVLPDARDLDDRGVERTVRTHVAGPQRLTTRLLSRLHAAHSARDGRTSRVIWVSSGGMYTNRLDLDGPPWRPRGAYSGLRAYAQTKRAQVILARQWGARLAGTGVRVHSMHPGWADTAAVQQALPGFARVIGGRLRTVDEGADTILYLAIARAVADAPPGRFWFDRAIRSAHALPGTRASDRERRRLWRLAQDLAGLDEPG